MYYPRLSIAHEELKRECELMNDDIDALNRECDELEKALERVTDALQDALELLTQEQLDEFLLTHEEIEGIA